MMNLKKNEKTYQSLKDILNGEKLRLLDELEANENFRKEIFDSVSIIYKKEQPEKMSFIERIKSRNFRGEASREWVEEEYLSAKRNVVDLYAKIERISALYNTLGKRKPNQQIEDMDLLVYYLFAGHKMEMFTHEEMLSILGTVFASNKKMRKNGDMMRLKELEQLENCFDDVGNFLPNNRALEVPKLFEHWLKQTNFKEFNLSTMVFCNEDILLYEDVSEEEINSFVDFVKQQAETHSEKLRAEELEKQMKKEQAEINAKDKKNKQKEMKKSLHELRNYISQDGTVVSTCDMAVLPDLLERCGLDEKTQKAYLTAMKKYSQEGAKREDVVIEENLDIDFFDNNTDATVLFLNDEEGKPFVFLDIEAFDAGNGQRVLDLFNKIRENRTAKATSTKPGYDGYAIFNHTARLFYKELEPKVYLIMALNKNQSGYQTYNNRTQNPFVLNQVSSIQRVLKSDKRTELIEENLRQADLLEAALTKKNKAKEKKVTDGNK